MADLLEAVRARALAALVPPPRLRLSDWIEANVYLPEGVSALPGAVRLWPFQREIADAIGDPTVERVTLVKPVRVGFTTLLTSALLMSAKLAAMHAAFVLDPSDTGELEWSDDIAWEPGAILRLPSGTDVKFSAPSQLAEAPAFLSHNIRLLAAALGIPTHFIDGDLSSANYSSLRAGLLPFLARMEMVQYQTIVPQFLRPVWRRWLALEVASGNLDLPADTSADWLFPRQPQVDPQRDMEAVAMAIGLRLKSRSQAISELGWNADDVDAEIAADQAREAKLKIRPKGGSPDAV